MQKGYSSNLVIDTNDWRHPYVAMKEFVFGLVNDNNENDPSWFLTFDLQI